MRGKVVKVVAVWFLGDHSDCSTYFVLFVNGYFRVVGASRRNNRLIRTVLCIENRQIMRLPIHLLS